MVFGESMSEILGPNCSKHMWPRIGPSVAHRSIGGAGLEQCNNCLTVKLTFSTYQLRSEGWVKITVEQIVEPDFTNPLKIETLE